MRCFIAIDIDKKTEAALGDLQQRLKNAADIRKGGLKWVRPENIHLTLKFLGEVKDEKITEVCKIVEIVAAVHKGFDLDIEQVGYFGNRVAKVVWVGAGAGHDQLCQLQKSLEQQLALAGWPAEQRQFTGHLTLCRVKNSNAGIKLAQITGNYNDFKVGTISADSLSVYQSQLRPTGSVYTVLANYKLK